jgi:organic radical activating enzyme
VNYNINKYYTNPPVVAVELFSSGWCNLECKYCYIPKTDFLKVVHKAIIERIKDGSLADDVIEIYGEDLQSVSHWGTEPTLTLSHFKLFYDKIEKACPKLSEIKISSNFMTNPHNLVKWVTEILPQSKQLKVSIQVSLDGPPFMTDKNRLGGSTVKIVENCLEFTKEINRVGTIHKVDMHLKPTAGDDDILTLCDMNKTIEYYEFFDNFVTEWVEANNKNVVEIMIACDPTLVLPGTYTSDDGKKFYHLLLNQLELKKRKWKSIQPPDSNYYWRYRGKFPFYKEMFIKQKMFTCSAGDSCMGMGDIPGTTHVCHQSFYMDHPEYYDEVKKYGLDEQTMEGMESGRTDLIKKHFIATKENEKQRIKMMYLTRAYNDFLELKNSNTIAQILELASCGQINPIYRNIKMAEQFSYFAQVLDCPVNNTMITGSQLVGCSSLLKVFGNGTFENILKRTIKELD